MYIHIHVCVTDGEDGPSQKRPHKGMLKQFYGSSANDTVEQVESSDPCDINGVSFKVIHY